MENLVVSLETAKKLKAAGFPQTSYWHWSVSSPKKAKPTARLCRPMGDAIYRDDSYNEYIFAPTAQEIADQLPENHVNSRTNRSARLKIFYENNEWTTGYPGDFYVSASTMAEALALVWLKSKEAPNGK